MCSGTRSRLRRRIPQCGWAYVSQQEVARGAHGRNRPMSLHQRDTPARRQSDRGLAPRPFTHWCHSAADALQSDRAGRTRNTPHTPLTCPAAPERADPAKSWSSRPPYSRRRARCTVCHQLGPQSTEHRRSRMSRPCTSVVRQHAARAHRPVRHCAGWPTSQRRGRAAVSIPLLTAERGRERARTLSASASKPSASWPTGPPADRRFCRDVIRWASAGGAPGPAPPGRRARGVPATPSGSAATTGAAGRRGPRAPPSPR